jgi:putative addiction module killer protein
MSNHSTLPLELHELLTDDGASPFRDWFDSLNVQAAAKIVTATLRMEQGNLGNVKWFSGIGEYRIDWGPGYRIYLARDGANTLLLLGGGTKRHQWRDVERALSRWDEYRRSRSRRWTVGLTRKFKETVVARVEREPRFARALLDEALTLFLNGEPGTAKLLLRDLINATLGFEELARRTGKPSKSLHRMLSDSGNPTMESLSAILVALKKSLNIEIRAVVRTA